MEVLQVLRVAPQGPLVTDRIPVSPSPISRLAAYLYDCTRHRDYGISFVY